MLINRLYSNEKVFLLWEKFITFDKRFIFWAVIIIVLVLLFIYKINMKKNPAKNIDMPNNVDEKENKAVNVTLDVMEKGNVQLGEMDKKLDKENTENKNDTKYIEPSSTKKVIMSICLVAIFWAVFDYLFYNVGSKFLPTEINRPNLLEAYYEYIYYSAVFGGGILFALSGIGMFKQNFRKKLSSVQGSSFRLTVVLSVVAETLLIIFSDKLKNIEIIEKFLNSITKNSVLSILSFIIVFIVLLIIMTIVMHIITGNEDGDPMIKGLTEKTKKIEAKLVMIGCNIIEGSLSIFDFIPDFFTTIGYVLFEIDIELLDVEKKEENLEKNSGDK